jgi:hypothetical protein
MLFKLIQKMFADTFGPIGAVNLTHLGCSLTQTDLLFQPEQLKNWVFLSGNLCETAFPAH